MGLAGQTGSVQRGWPRRLRSWALGAAVLVAGCTSFDPSFPEPEDYKVHGIDVARYQGDIDWHKAKADDVMFAWIKATEGGDHLDSKFLENWHAAKKAGVPRGAYHFWYFCRNGAEQLQWFVDNVPYDPEALPPVLDMEWNGHSPTCKRRPSKEEVLREMQVFIAGIERHYGKQPVIYTAIDMHQERLDGEFDEYPFWVRSVAAFPTMHYPTRGWVFWQYTAEGRVEGVDGHVDRNVFNGSRKEWEAWLAANTTPDAEYVGAVAYQ